MQRQYDQLGRTMRMTAAHRKAKRAVTHNNEVTVGLVSQKVRGLRLSLQNASLTDWFGYFRQNDQDGKKAILFLQETHLEEQETAAVTVRYSRHWGFEHTRVTEQLFLERSK